MVDDVQRVRPTASGSAGDNRVTVVVDANGVVIETIFSDDIDNLDYSEIAAAFTRAHQNAMIELRKFAERVVPAPESLVADPAFDEETPEVYSRSVLDRAW